MNDHDRKRLERIEAMLEWLIQHGATLRPSSKPCPLVPKAVHQCSRCHDSHRILVGLEWKDCPECGGPK